MGEKRRVFLLIFVMTTVALCAVGISLYTLYEAAFEEERVKLLDIAKSQARTMEAMARFNSHFVDEDIPGRIMARTVEEIADIHDSLAGFGRTGEFSLGKQERGEIVFILKHRNWPTEYPESLIISSPLAEPMRRALAGESGTLVGLDYRGKRVVAAYEPVATLDFGLVAKIDLDEIQAPFIRASQLAVAATVVLVLFGAGFLLRISNPLLRRLQESEVWYRSIFESSPNGVLLLGEVVEDCNEQACKLCLLERADIIGRSFSGLMATSLETISEIDHCLELTLAGQPQSIHLSVQRQDGSILDIDLLMKVVEVSERRIALIIMRDVSERMQALEDLHESEKRYHTVAEVSPVGIFHTDFEGNFLYVNERWCEITGFSRQEALQKGLAWGVHPEDRERVMAEWCGAAEQNIPFKAEYRLQHTSGRVTWVFGQVAAETNENHETVSHVGTITDITERKQAEEALQERNSFIETVMDNLPIGLSVEAAETHKYLYANRKVEEILGWPREDLWQSLEHFWELLCPDPGLRTYYYDRIYGDIKRGDACQMDWEVPIVKGDGDEAILLVNGIPMLDKNLMIITLQDITERKRAEKLQTQLELAAEVQSKLLPHKELEVSGFEFAAWCQPAHHVGGDFYDWQKLASGAVSFTLGDVMGKGMPASMLMATVRATIRAVSQEHPPALALQLADQAIRQDLDRSDSFVTLFHAQLEVATRRLTYVDCGHGWVFCRRSNGQVEELNPRGLPLGVPSADEYQEGTLVLNGGDTLVLYSDGLVDAFPDVPPDARVFATEIEGASTAKEIVDRLVGLVPKDNPLPDDLTILVVRCNEYR